MLKPLGFILPAIFTLAFVGWVISGSQTFKTCFQDNKHTNTYDTLYENDESVIKAIVRLRLNSECGLAFFGKQSDIIAALATVVIAGFTGTLWYTSRTQSDITRDALRLAKDEFSATHRPKILVQSVTLAFTGDADHSGRIDFMIANAGEAEATIIRFLAFSYSKDAHAVFLPAFRENDHTPREPKGGLVLNPGEVCLVCRSMRQI
jgi:hypothetical protein